MLADIVHKRNLYLLEQALFVNRGKVILNRHSPTSPHLDKISSLLMKDAGRTIHSISNPDERDKCLSQPNFL
jgi:hypothetical protein